MKKTKTKDYKILQKVMFTFIIILLSIFSYRAADTFLDEDSQLNSNQVWCQNCQTYHDRATAEQEEEKLIWCVNCKRYHAPGEDE